MKSMLRKLIPRWLLCSLRAVYILIVLKGQARRDANGCPVDRQGRHIPWITYPAIDFLDSISLEGKDVLEFGSGASTLYFQDRCGHLVTVEHHPEWYGKIRTLCHSRTELHLCEDFAEYARFLQQERTYDVIVLDGKVRKRCARLAVDRLRPGGMIILDNTEWFPNTAGVLREAGFFQMDFIGFTPVNSFPAVTSIFFREMPQFDYLPKAESWAPVGGVRYFQRLSSDED